MVADSLDHIVPVGQGVASILVAGAGLLGEMAADSGLLIVEVAKFL